CTGLVASGPQDTMTTPKKKTASAKAPSARKKRAVPPTLPGGVSIEPIIEALRKRVPKAAQARAEAFARAFYRRMSAEEMAQHSLAGWAELAWDFLERVQRRKPGTADVRVFNATLDRDGWESPHTVVQVVNDDMPFLVDSVTMALAERGIGVHVLGHPVVRVERDRAGRLVAIGDEAGEKARGESLMHLEIDRQAADAMPAIAEAIRAVLEDVRAAVVDWAPMRAKMLEIADELETRRMPASVSEAGRKEAQAFLRWAADNHFTFLGYREYD